MKKLYLILIPLIFGACDNQDIKKTKILNDAPLVTAKVAKKEIKKDMPTKEERLKKLSYKKEIELTKIKLKNQENIAALKAKKEEKLKELELQKAKEIELQKTKQKAIEANNSLELAKIKSKTVIEVKEKETALYKLIAIVVLIIAFIWLVIKYLQGVAKRKHEAYLKEQELQFQAHIQESKLKHENISKMLDIIKDEKSDPAIKKEMAKLLTHNKNILINNKK